MDGSERGGLSYRELSYRELSQMVLLALREQFANEVCSVTQVQYIHQHFFVVAVVGDRPCCGLGRGMNETCDQVVASSLRK